MGHIIPFKGRKKSSVHNLNLLFNSGKYFLMDNHLAASWCWSQVIDFSKKYNLFHIDRHYDLLYSNLDTWVNEIKKVNIDFKKNKIEDLLDMKYSLNVTSGTKDFQILRFDNYLPIFHKIHPNIIEKAIFATHKDGNYWKEFPFSEKNLIDLPGNIDFWTRPYTEDDNKHENKWIINIDIDYFFYDEWDDYYRILTDEYIIRIAKGIKEIWDNIEVLTIALSPEFCNGWDEAEYVAKLITDTLELEWYE